MELVDRLRSDKLIHGAENQGHEFIAAAVSSVVKYVQPTGRPFLRESPGGHQWCTDVVASVDQHAGDTVQSSSLADELVLLQKGVVPPIVCDQSREAQAELRVQVTRVWRVTRGERDMGIFPGTPLVCRAIANNRVGSASMAA